jgi:hypothetical protein
MGKGKWLGLLVKLVLLVFWLLVTNQANAGSPRQAGLS